MEPIPCHTNQWYVYNNKEKIGTSMECRYIHVNDFIKMLGSMRSDEQIKFMNTVNCAIDVHITEEYDIYIFRESSTGKLGVVCAWCLVWAYNTD